MQNGMVPFNPAQVPAHLQQSALKTIGDNLSGGLEGRGFNRISTNGKAWRFIKGGAEIGMVQGVLDVVIVGATPAVSRTFYMKKWSPGEKSEKPVCYSIGGERPEADSPQQQCSTCAACPQNQLGSAINDRGEKKRACGFSKRIIIVSADQLQGDAYALDVKAMSLFGDGYPDHKAYSLNTYGKNLKEWRVSVAGVRTRLTFDPNQTAPSVLFSPVGYLSEGEVAQVIERSQRDDINTMLQITGIDEAEVGQPQPGTAVAAPQYIAAPMAPVAPPQYAPQAQYAPVAPTPPVAPAAPAFAPQQQFAPAEPPPGFPPAGAAPQQFAPAAPPPGFPAAGAPSGPPQAKATRSRKPAAPPAAAAMPPGNPTAGGFPPPPQQQVAAPAAPVAAAGFPATAQAQAQTHVGAPGAAAPAWGNLMDFQE